MIVTCERCATQFQLDDARVPDSGVRVRCSRCKHAFEIRKQAAVPSAAAASEEEESDWQFNEEPRGGASQGSSASVVDDLLGGAEDDDRESLFGGSSASGLELGDDPPQAADPDTGAEQGAPASASRTQAPAHRPSAAPHRDDRPAPMPEEGASGLDLEGDPEPRPAPLVVHPDPEEAAAPDAASSASADDVLDPVEDLASALAGELEPGSHGDGDDAGATPAADELASADWDALADVDGDLGSGASRAPRVDPDALIDDRPRWRAGVERLGGLVGWAAMAALFAFGLHGALLPQRAVSAGPPVESQAPGVELEDVRGRFVDHASEGPVYVVSGRIVNTGSRPVSAGTLAVEVLDAEGTRLATPAPAGLPLSVQALREEPLEGVARRSPALGPGQSVGFEAVIGRLPAGARRLGLAQVEPALADTPPKPRPRKRPDAPDAPDASDAPDDASPALAGTGAADPASDSDVQELREIVPLDPSDDTPPAAAAE